VDFRCGFGNHAVRAITGFCPAYPRLARRDGREISPVVIADASIAGRLEENTGRLGAAINNVAIYDSLIGAK
jgi:hypothetical protein